MTPSPYPEYEPSQEEKDAVQYCLDRGAPQNVKFYDIGSYASAPASKSYKETWFSMPDGKTYKADSELLVKAPQVSVNEMQSLGMLTPPPTPA